MEVRATESIVRGKRLPVPSFWRGTERDIDEVMGNVTRGSRFTLGPTAGGRVIHGVSYGEQPPINRTANLSSAIGASKPCAYVNKAERRPSLMLIGGVHGSEMEGIVALLNLIHLLERGTDFRGHSHDLLTQHIEDVRLTIVPCLNLDGRARVELESYVEETLDTYQYWMQGSRSDGVLYSWPAVREFHPMKNAGFLGGYFNDDGVNFMHDDFFGGPSEEVRSLFQLIDREAPDLIVLLHSAADSPFFFCDASYLPLNQQESVFHMDQRLTASMHEKGLPYQGLRNTNEQPYEYTPDFNLTRALHHHSFATSLTFESCAGIETPHEDRRLSWEHILDGHFLLFQELMTTVRNDFEIFAQPFLKAKE